MKRSNNLNLKSTTFVRIWTLKQRLIVLVVKSPSIDRHKNYPENVITVYSIAFAQSKSPNFDVLVEMK